MYRGISYCELSEKLLKQLSEGAFLTVKVGDKVNAMTISCGSVGYTWMKPTFTVMVRYSRYTYELMEKAQSFAVSLPLNGQLKKELALCGTVSGRDSNKAEELGFTIKEGRLEGTAVIDECDLHLECRIIYRQPVNPDALDEEIRKKVYSDGDYHMFYIGEVVSIYAR